MRLSSRSVIPLALALALTGCSGGSSDQINQTPPPPTPPPTPPPPPTNTAPVAMKDVVSTVNDVSITIAVLENDTDVDGDTLSVVSILTPPLNGSVTFNGTSITYTPNANFIGEDSLTYQISDGELTAGAQIVIQNSQTFTIHGSVLGTELSSGKVIATVNGEISESTMNGDGSYAIDIELTSTQGNILLRAQGAQNSDQSQASLVSFVGSTGAVFNAIDNNKNVDASAVSGLKVNQLTTARYLLADSINSQDISVNDQGFADLLIDVNATDLIELAAFIKLIINDNSYSLPVGQTTESFFTGSTSETTGLSIREFLIDKGILNSEGDPTAAYVQDLANAITTTVEQFKQPIDAQPVAGREDATFVGDLRKGYLPSSADLYEFDGSNTGFYWQSSIIEADMFPFEWNISNGDLVISYTKSVTSGINSFVTYSPSAVERFGVEAQQKAAQIAASTGFPSGQVIITRQPSEDKVKIISFDKTRDQIFRERTDLEVLILNDGSQQFTYPFESQRSIVENKVSSKKSLLSSDADVLGDWVIHFNYLFAPEIEGFTNTLSRLSGDIVSFTADAGAAGQISNKTFTWSLDNSQKLLLDDGTTSISITPFLQNDDGMIAAYTLYEDDLVVARYVRELFQVEQTNVTLASLQTNLPEAYVSQINATQPDAWETGLLDIEYVFGYNIKANNTADRLVNSFEPNTAGSGYYFDYDWLNQAAVQTDSTLQFVEESDSSYSQRTWRFITKNSFGRIWVLESFVFTQNIGPFQSVSIGLPRINSIIKTDLSLYQEAWSRTIEKGIVSP